MSKNNIIISQILIFFAITSFFLGFYFDEISMGAGGYNGDFTYVQRSIELFNNNSIKNSILLFSETSNRPPLIYILHKLFNPFFTDELNFRRSVFIISMTIPILFFLCLKEKFQNTNKLLLTLLSSTILFNPYVRNSSYWGLEENYAIIASLISFLFYLKISKQKKINSNIDLIKIFILTFSSSLCVYFDQKFVIVPLICFLKIIFDNYSKNTKIFSVLFYVLFSIPYIFLISIWGGIFPSNIYHIGSQFYFHHFGFGLTMIAFIILPFLIFQIEEIQISIKNFLSNKKFLWLILVILIYISILVFFYDNEFLNNKLDGGGIVKKLSFIFFDDILLKQFFVYSSFVLSWIFIFFFIKNFKDLLIIFYFLTIAVITRPFYQEYYDPIMFILLFFFFNINLKIDYLKIYVFYFYYLIFLVGTISYYL